MFTPAFVHQLLAHIAAYAEVLFRWEMPAKRIELLKAVDAGLVAGLDPPVERGSSTLGALPTSTTVRFGMQDADCWSRCIVVVHALWQRIDRWAGYPCM